MLTLNDGRSELWQWDTGRTLAVDADCSQVHFSNKVFGRSIDVDVADGVAIIPDVLLQTDNDLSVWAFVGTAENGYTKISKTFMVNRRNKPADYVFTPTEQITLQTIQNQIGDLSDLTTVAKDTLVAAINEAARTGGGGGTTDHTKLTNRNAENQHPMSAITGLVKALGGKMDSNNPVGTGSFSMGRKNGSLIGPSSHAEGYDTTASGQHSHAEGQDTMASGDNSHAEGQNTKVSGNCSHVQGKYNIEDSSNLYAHIVGNGTAAKRSNAHTVDWSGNAWYAGDVFVGSASGTNKDDGSKKLATEEYVNNEIADCIKAPATASVGQTIIVKAVDESGKPTEWEAADMPEVLPNPNALTFTGAVTGSYDGSAPVSVEIPSGGDAGKSVRHIATVSVTEGTTSYDVTVDSNGDALNLESVYILTKKFWGNTGSYIQIKINGKELTRAYGQSGSPQALELEKMGELQKLTNIPKPSEVRISFGDYYNGKSAVTSVHFWSSGSTVNTTIEIYGVDA